MALSVRSPELCTCITTDRLVVHVGHCYLPDEADEAVLALATDSTNSVLVSGDTHGRVAVWDISDYCTSVQQHVSAAGRTSHKSMLLGKVKLNELRQRGLNEIIPVSIQKQEVRSITAP